MKKTLLMLSIAVTTLFFSCQKVALDESNNSAVGNNTLVNSVTENQNNEPAATSSAVACVVKGWASQNGGTTGGSGTATIVTTYDQLKAAITSSTVKVVQVRGTITIPSGGRINFQDQTGKTIFGEAGARLVSNDQTKANSGIIYIKRIKNLVIRNLIFEGPGAYDTDRYDNATLDDCQNIWIDHCEFRDGVDGNFDFKNKSNFITVSYCKFNYLKAPRAGGSGGSNDHRYSNLIGSSDGATADRGTLNITFARCWWAPGCVERMPRIRFGKVHIVNNYFNSTVSNYCVGAGFEANVLIEGNVFENVDEPIRFIANDYTAVTQRNNTFPGATGNTNGNGTAFTPPYSFTVVSPSAAKTAILGTGGAGATVGGNNCTSL